MANRQYIGARYVPKYFNNPEGGNDWISGISYEALTIVKYSDNWFTSTKPVPATIGSPNLNSEYWVNTGTSSGAPPDLTEIEQEIEELKENKQNNRKVLIVMDSYGYYKFNNMSIGEWALKYSQLNGKVIFLGGAGFNINNPNTFLKCITDNLSTLGNLAEYTDIFIFGGANDFGVSADNINAGMQATMNYINTNFNNPKVYLGMLSKTIGSQYIASTKNIYKNCYAYGMSFIPNVEYIVIFKSQMQSDNLHPNTDSIQEISKFLSQALISYSVSTDYKKPFTVNYNNSQISGGTNVPITGNYYVKNNTVEIKSLNSNLGVVTFATPATIGGNVNIKLFDISDTCYISTEFIPCLLILDKNYYGQYRTDGTSITLTVFNNDAILAPLVSIKNIGAFLLPY